MINQGKFIEESITLIRKELTEGNTLAARVLFSDELSAEDWYPEDAVSALFEYASNYGWGNNEDDI